MNRESQFLVPFWMLTTAEPQGQRETTMSKVWVKVTYRLIDLVFCFSSLMATVQNGSCFPNLDLFGKFRYYASAEYNVSASSRDPQLTALPTTTINVPSSFSSAIASASSSSRRFQALVRYCARP